MNRHERQFIRGLVGFTLTFIALSKASVFLPLNTGWGLWMLVHELYLFPAVSIGVGVLMARATR